MVTKPVPIPCPDTAAFWAGCREGKLLYQVCRETGEAQFYPRAICRSHPGTALEWRESQGVGVLYSFTVVQRAPTAAFASDVPYVLALVDFSEGFRMMANVLNCDPEMVRIGLPVQVVFERRGDQSLPQVEPVA